MSFFDRYNDVKNKNEREKDMYMQRMRTARLCLQVQCFIPLSSLLSSSFYTYLLTYHSFFLSIYLH